MTSDRSLDPIQRQLESFSDQVFQGAPSSPGISIPRLSGQCGDCAESTAFRPSIKHA